MFFEIKSNRNKSDSYNDGNQTDFSETRNPCLARVYLFCLRNEFSSGGRNKRLLAGRAVNLGAAEIFFNLNTLIACWADDLHYKLSMYRHGCLIGFDIKTIHASQKSRQYEIKTRNDKFEKFFFVESGGGFEIKKYIFF